ncbi:armadillo repeat-containing protein 7 isoform X3 [Sorex araneus]|uniref:armadillo repeat-containing protein 7 isoform X3 n=1 Tax=Sorex araneus TaxID=42254 RepID=UPI002433EC88|nr:armadillo repeat-containing protein 7 isoform X3 [Sorex araneus]
MAQKPKVDPHVGRLGYLQALVTEFQETQSQDAREQVLANLANFAYDPHNYPYLRQLQVLDLFLDSLSEENETLVEFALGTPGRAPQTVSGAKDKNYSWLSVRESLLVGIPGPDGVPGTERASSSCKAGVVPAVLSRPVFVS